jgi:hypothetical protein
MVRLSVLGRKAGLNEASNNNDGPSLLHLHYTEEDACCRGELTGAEEGACRNANSIACVNGRGPAHYTPSIRSLSSTFLLVLSSCPKGCEFVLVYGDENHTMNDAVTFSFYIACTQ